MERHTRSELVMKRTLTCDIIMPGAVEGDMLTDAVRDNMLERGMKVKTIAHDHWCALLADQTKDCDCEPDVTWDFPR